MDNNKCLYCCLMIINLVRGLKSECVINNDTLFVDTKCLYTQMRSVQCNKITNLHKSTLKYKSMFEIISEMQMNGHVSLKISKPLQLTHTVFRLLLRCGGKTTTKQ